MAKNEWQRLSPLDYIQIALKKRLVKGMATYVGHKMNCHGGHKVPS